MSRSVFAIEQIEERAQRLWQKRAAIEALLYGTTSGPYCITQVCLHEVVPKSLFVRAKSLRDRTEVKAMLVIRKTGVVFALYVVNRKW